MLQRDWFDEKVSERKKRLFNDCAEIRRNGIYFDAVGERAICIMSGEEIANSAVSLYSCVLKELVKH